MLPLPTRINIDPQSYHIIFGETVGVATTASGKGNILLTVVITILVLALVALHFHADYDLFATNGKTYEVTNTVTILH